MRTLSAVLLGILIAACGVGGAPEGGGGGGGGGGGSGGGGGGGGGDGSGSGSGSGGDSSGVGAFLHQVGVKFCDQAFMCKANFPTDQGVTFEQAFGTSAMACYADEDMYNNVPAVEAAISAGKITYNQADATACLAGLTFPACTTFWTAGPNAPAACATALVGHVADGQACTVDFECSGAMSYCDETTKKCTPDTSGARTTPAPELGLHVTLRR